VAAVAESWYNLPSEAVPGTHDLLENDFLEGEDFTLEDWYKPFQVPFPEVGQWNETEFARRLEIILRHRREREARRLQTNTQLTPECYQPATKNVTQCCERLITEAYDACYAYRFWGFTQISCYPWEIDIKASCELYCGDCNKTADAVEQICRFTMQVLGNGVLVDQLCRKTTDNWRNRRCPSSCLVPEFVCYDNSSYDCMAECGNWDTCNCHPTFSGTLINGDTLLPDTCTGETVEKGLIPGRVGEFYSCQQKVNKPQCQHYRPEGQKCAYHRWCSPNMCIIRNVTCVKPYECADEGVCMPHDGYCHYNDRLDGSPCNDGADFTYGDQCIRGACVGTVDYCLMYNVTCEPVTPCTLGGYCHKGSGKCEYQTRPDGTYCNDGRPYTVEDRCEGGLCVGKEVNLCNESGIVCVAPNSCYKTPTCDGRTGTCPLAVMQENGFLCDDGDPTTFNDTCIDGLCIGAPLAAEFRTLGDGECSDRNRLQMARYTGDAVSEQDCQQVCLDDPQCRAFNYAFPSCSLWGTVRDRAPQSIGRDWTFMSGSVPVSAVVVEATVPPETAGGRVSVCRLKSEYGDPTEKLTSGEIEGEDVFTTRSVLIFVLVCLAAFFLVPLLHCLKVLILWDGQSIFIGQGSNPPINVQPSSPAANSLRATGKSFEDWPVLPPQSPTNSGGAVVSGYPVHHPNEVSLEKQSEDVHPSLDPNTSPEAVPTPPASQMGDSPEPPPDPQPESMQVREQQVSSKWTRKTNVKAEGIEGVRVVKPSEGELAHEHDPHDHGRTVAPTDVANAGTYMARGIF